MYDYKLHTGYIGTSAFERFKSHLPGKAVPQALICHHERCTKFCSDQPRSHIACLPPSVDVA